MKRISKALTLASAVVLFAAATSQAQQIVVSVRPHRPATYVAVRPHRPSAQHVWVAEEWTPEGGSYGYHAGYWAVPPHPHAEWTGGHWKHSRRGYIWIAGHWN